MADERHAARQREPNVTKEFVVVAVAEEGRDPKTRSAGDTKTRAER